MLNFSVNKGVNFYSSYTNYLPIKKENKDIQTKQITDNDYKNYSSAISAMNKPIVSFGANNYTTQLKPENAPLREKIFQIDGWCFEKLAGYIFENAVNKNGEKLFCNVEVTRASGDGGVDILLEQNNRKSNNGVDLILDGKNKRTLVQCKHFSKGHCVDIETMQALADCREKEMFRRNYKKEDINCLMIASSGVNNNVLTEYMPTVKDFDYKIMNLDNLIDFAKKYNVKIDDEVLNPLIEETKERNQCYKELLSQKDKIKEMLNDEAMTIDEIIQTLTNEFKDKYPHLVKGNYISDFIKFTFNPPECFELLKQEGYEFEENLGTGNQTIFSVKKGNETFVVYYSDINRTIYSTNMDNAKNYIDKVNGNNKSILVSKSNFSEGTKAFFSLKKFDKVYTVVDDKLMEYDRTLEKLESITNLLQKEGYKFEANLGIGKQTIFSVSKDNETFVVYYSDSNKSLKKSQIDIAKTSIDKVKTNRDDKLILVSTSGFGESKGISDSLKNFDKVYTVIDHELWQYDGIPKKLKPIANLLQQEGYKFEENLIENCKQNIFSVKKDNETFVVYYSDTENIIKSCDIDNAKNSIDKAKTHKNDKSILISKSGFQEGKKTTDSLKNFDKVYTVVDNKLREYDGIPEKFRNIVNLLKQEGYEFEENLSKKGPQNLFLVKKDNEIFVIYYSDSNKAIDNYDIDLRIKGCIEQTKINENNKIILIAKNGFLEGNKTRESLKNFDKVYMVVGNKLQEYDGIPEKLRPIVNLLKQEGYEFEENLGKYRSQNIFLSKKKGKFFIVTCSNQKNVLSTLSTNELLKSVDNIIKNKNGIILVTKKGIAKSCKEGFEEKTITDENGNEYIIYIKT